MLASGRTGEWAYARDRECDDHYQRMIATWTHDLCTFTGRLIDKAGEKRHFDMT